MTSLSPAVIGTPLAIFDFIGSSELVVILLLVLIFFGGEKMPQFARGLGKVMREFRKAASGVEQEIKRAMEEEPTLPVAPVTHPHAIPATQTILPPPAPTSTLVAPVPPAPAATPPAAASPSTSAPAKPASSEPRPSDSVLDAG